jgi:hypothetical protein
VPATVPVIDLAPWFDGGPLAHEYIGEKLDAIGVT